MAEMEAMGVICPPILNESNSMLETLLTDASWLLTSRSSAEVLVP